MLPNNTIRDIFNSIDAMDADKFASFIKDDGEFIFGEQVKVKGNADIVAAVEGFFSTLKSLSHRNMETWEGGDGKTMFVGGDVRYELPNGAYADIPFLNKFLVNDGKIARYQVFVDPTPLFQAAQKDA